MTVFNKYSKFYDSLYQDKNYPEEVAFIKKVITKLSTHKVKHILSLGCGTCSHELLLGKKYKITGVDRSASMLAIGEQKIKDHKLTDTISLYQQDVQKIDLNTKADFCMSLFNVIGYQTTNQQMLDVLGGVNKHLKSKGLFVFDCWHLPAVLSDPPTTRLKITKHPTGEKIMRYTTPKLNQFANTLDINFKVLQLKNKTVIGEVDETHTMRYWSIPEIELFLTASNFKLVKVSKFLNLSKLPEAKEWDMFIVAQKVN